MSPSIPPQEPTTDQIRQQVDAIISDLLFVRSKRLVHFLQFIVEETLAGNDINEQIIGITVFDKQPGYSTGEETIVRTEAHELRRRLTKFYEKHPDDIVRISV